MTYFRVLRKLFFSYNPLATEELFHEWVNSDAVSEAITNGYTPEEIVEQL